MQPLVYRTIELDRCAQTGGVWFDAQELVELTNAMHEGDDFVNTFCEQEWPEYGDSRAEGGCPHGHGPMKSYDVPRSGSNGVVLTPTTGGSITLDLCSKCFGIWVDGSELRVLREVVLYNRAHGGPAVIEPVTKTPWAEAIRRVERLAFVKWLRNFLPVGRG
jgi:Zn-finger nucleic acid-binding protein